MKKIVLALLIVVLCATCAMAAPLPGADDNLPVDVTADNMVYNADKNTVVFQGRVEDGNQKVSMSGEVQATYEENVLTGDLAVFLNTSRTLTFPDGAALDGPTLSGTATRLVWDLNTNILTGDQGVRMRWTPSDTDTSGGAADADTLPENAQNDAQKESRS